MDENKQSFTQDVCFRSAPHNGAARGMPAPHLNFRMFTNEVVRTRNLLNDTTAVTPANPPDHDTSHDGHDGGDRRALATPIRFYYMRDCSVTNSKGSPHFEKIRAEAPVESPSQDGGVLLMRARSVLPSRRKAICNTGVKMERATDETL